MLLLLAIVQSEDAPALAKKLTEQGLRLTQINSTGGLFGSGSVALLLGIDDSAYDAVLDAIVATCKTRTKHISAVATPEPTFFFFTPMEVEVGGAVVFGVPVERFIQLPSPNFAMGESVKMSDASGTTGAPNSYQIPTLSTEETLTQMIDGAGKGGGGQMKLIVAIVQGEDADDVIRAMLAAGHRLTRINTTGGFLRRGNATLLIGVEDHQIDEVIALMQSTTRRRTESAPIGKGIPEYAATVFVLDSSHFIRI
jgi:uncharacterized protein YaaQ